MWGRRGRSRFWVGDALPGDRPAPGAPGTHSCSPLLSGRDADRGSAHSNRPRRSRGNRGTGRPVDGDGMGAGLRAVCPSPPLCPGDGGGGRAPAVTAGRRWLRGDPAVTPLRRGCCRLARPRSRSRTKPRPPGGPAGPPHAQPPARPWGLTAVSGSQAPAHVHLVVRPPLLFLLSALRRLSWPSVGDEMAPPE